MHGTDAAGFQEALINLALTRGTLGDGNDARYVRGRVAFMLWIPSFLLVMILAHALQSAVVVPFGVATLLSAFWLFVARAPQEKAQPVKNIG
ncbi:MAG: hypothetical protein E6H95_10700 [Chloroflexi bacterium]|nr:MAG: hypothetical protein E6I21_02735 [Chloroflexota bacterium]TMG26637.1 MAG: hypothetical protein E6H95_10700 [Chloroflexota bacterium]